MQQRNQPLTDLISILSISRSLNNNMCGNLLHLSDILDKEHKITKNLHQFFFGGGGVKAMLSH